MNSTEHGTSKRRLAILATPRSGNTYLGLLLSRFYDLPHVAVHQMNETDWAMQPEEVLLRLHWRREPKLLARLEREGYRIITIARHPLDVLISILHVVVYDVDSEAWLLGSKGDERPIWGSMPRSRNFLDYCQSERAFELLSVTCDYWQQPGIVCLRYEDLVADPGQILESIESQFGPPRRVPDVERILSDLTISNLGKTSFNNHFWKGKPGLWRELLPGQAVGGP